ncbi:Interferon-induced GTP-binding protein Mx [Leucoagaricus sp. SymC.cos]|nr:Interferon-induced GTP-binding protein Mx [Leucoagaricus sp. SymC.cos]
MAKEDKLKKMLFVISLLNVLAKQNVNKLLGIGISVIAVSADNANPRMFKDIENGKYDVVVINPENLMTSTELRELWKKSAFMQQIFDEGHCTAQRGKFCKHHLAVGILCYLISDSVLFYVVLAMFPPVSPIYNPPTVKCWCTWHLITLRCRATLPIHAGTPSSTHASLGSTESTPPSPSSVFAALVLAAETDSNSSYHSTSARHDDLAGAAPISDSFSLLLSPSAVFSAHVLAAETDSNSSYHSTSACHDDLAGAAPISDSSSPFPSPSAVFAALVLAAETDSNSSYHSTSARHDNFADAAPISDSSSLLPSPSAVFSALLQHAYTPSPPTSPLHTFSALNHDSSPPSLFAAIDLIVDSSPSPHPSNASLIASVGRGGNSSDIKLVEGLVTLYIKKINYIILLTVACETDFENQGAHQLAKQFDPEGKRTIGILTKPDRIPIGEEQNWLQFICNEKEPLENNWFCVKQPSSNDLKQKWTWKEARNKEREFFTTVSPWNNLEPMYQQYLQMDHLVERLSRVLSDLIAKRLPEIQQEIENMITKMRQQIGLLPKAPPQNPLNEVAKLIKDFDVDMKRQIDGIPSKDGVIQQIPTPEFLRFEEEEPGYTGEGTEDQADNLDAESDLNRVVHVDEVYCRMQDELPGNFPFIVQHEYIQEILARWDGPARALCEAIHRILKDYTQELVKEHFGHFSQGHLEHQIRYGQIFLLKRY